MENTNALPVQLDGERFITIFRFALDASAARRRAHGRGQFDIAAGYDSALEEDRRCP